MYVIAFFQTLPPCLVGVHHRRSSRPHRNASLTIQSAFVRPDSFPQNSEDFVGNNRVLVAVMMPRPTIA
jgi:hypothetical protein